MMVCKEQRNRREISEDKATKCSYEERRRVMQLGEGVAGDHIARTGEATVRAQADAGAGDAHPDLAAAALHGTGEGAVVDDFAADGRETADASEGFVTKEDAAAGSAGGGGSCVSDPARGIEFEEEEQESGDGGALRQ